MPAVAEKPRVRKKRRLLPYMVSGGIPAALLAVFYILRSRAEIMDSVSEGFSSPVRRFLGGLCSRVPFSMMEAAIAVLLVWLAVFLVITVIKIFREKSASPIARRLPVIAIVALWIWAGFAWLWNVGYFSPTVEERSGLDCSDGVAFDDLAAAARLFAERANALSGEVKRDADGHFAEDYSDYVSRYGGIYSGLREEFPFLSGPVTRPKSVFFSKVMSYVGFSGVYFPFFGETNINTDQPGALIPMTIAHEIGHQLGVQYEAEANFTGIAACVTSGDTVYEYSGYLQGLISLMNAVYKYDRDVYAEIRATYSDAVVTDIRDSNEYWRSFEGTVSTVSDKVYEGFLKSNNQPLGLKSYGACVDLLTAWVASGALG